MNSAGDWELDVVEDLIPDQARLLILGHPPPSPSEFTDMVAWGPSQDGEFSMKQVYSSVASARFKPTPPIFPLIWKWEGLERIKILLWRITKGAILPNEALCRRGLTLNPSCPRCRTSPESINHVFRDCPVATAVWMEVRGITQSDQFFNVNFSMWLQENIGRGDSRRGSTKLGVVLDVIWKARNDVVFNNTNRDSHTMACVVKNTMIGINRAKDMYRRTNEPTPSTSATSHIRWTPPMHGWIKLNCDGARSTSHGKATSGGIFCNDNGGFCFGFSVSLGDCSILSAELWAVLYGVRFAWA